VLGETFDIGIGNMLDNFARAMKLDPAWGSTVEKTAIGGKYIDMPYTVKGMDFSFTGLLTHATKQVGKHSREDICFSVQEVSFSMLCEAVERAMLLTNSSELCVCGGVAQNTRLKEMLGYVAADHGAKIGYAANEFNADNGAMIAFVGERMLEAGISAKLGECDIEQRYRIDRARVV
jgi:tRNA A37 threonylcarbamoyltransferase TsaD